MLNVSFTNDKSKKRVIRKGKFIFKNLQLAIIDLGTNSVRLDIYRLQNRDVRRLYRAKIMIRLGDEVFKTGQLSHDGMLRTFKAFMKFKRMMQQHHVTEVVAFGTSALRTAYNSKEFLQILKERTGISVKIISGKEEGELIALGIVNNIMAPKCHYGLIDIGGGSTEISVCYGKKILSSQSFKLGANRLQQMYFQTMPLKFRRGRLHPLLEVRQYIKEELSALDALTKRYPVKILIGSSGTIRAVGKILKKFGRSGQPIARSDLSALISEMQDMNRDEIKRIPGLESKRVDLILPGSILLEEILIAMKGRHLVVTELALRDGILQRELKKYVRTIA